MKRILFFIFALQLFNTINTYSQQSGWVWQNPLPQGNPIFKIKMLDANNGMFFNRDNILRTTTGGATWIHQYTNFPWHISSVSVVNDNLYFMLTDSTVLINSTDKGNTWKYVSDIENIDEAQITFINSQIGFAVKRNSTWYNSELSRTGDGGKNWILIETYDSISPPTLFYAGGQTVYASAGKYSNNTTYKTKLFKSTNSGESWDSLANNIYIGAPNLYFVNEQTGYIYGAKSYKTTNGGNNWSLVNVLTTVSAMQFIDSQTGFALSSSRLYITTNSGVNWEYNTIYINGAAYAAGNMYFANINTGYASAGMGVILKTTNSGVNWNKLTGENILNPYPNEYLWGIAFSNTLTGFACGEGGKLLRTTNSGVNWGLIQLNPELSFEAIAYSGPQTFYVSDWMSGKVLKTTDTGNSWDTTYANVYGITELEFINENTGFGVCKYSSFIKTTNGGVNWVATQPFGSQNWALDFIDENTGFAGGSRTYKTTNGGSSWDTISVGNYAEEIQFINHTTGFIAGNNIVLKTTNSGLSWESVFSLGIYGYFNDMHFANEKTGFVMSYSDIYKTTNSGLVWRKLDICNKSFGLQAMSFTDSLNGWVTGFNGLIIRTSNGGESIFIEPFIEIPTSFYLYQNYPNPFNPVTTIRYGLPKDLNVKLKIYDLLGRLVKLVVNENQSAGNYSVNFDGSSYASGVYFYTIETPEFIQSKKMVLLK